MSTRDLIDAIYAGDSVAIDNAFNQEMYSRIADKIDDMRSDVAQNMFKSVTESKENEDDDDDDAEDEDEDDDEDEESKEKVDEENLEELNKSTLRSYVGKAAGSVTKGVFRHAYDSGRTLSSNPEKSEKSYNKAAKRVVGISKALDRMTKEETEITEEQLDEIIGKTPVLNKYLNSHGPKGGTPHGYAQKHGKDAARDMADALEKERNTLDNRAAFRHDMIIKGLRQVSK